MTVYPSLLGMSRLCGLEQELVLKGEKHVRLCAGSAEELLEGCMVHVGGCWFLLVRIANAFILAELQSVFILQLVICVIFFFFSQVFVMQPRDFESMCVSSLSGPFLLLVKRFPWVINNVPTASFQHWGGRC